MVTDHRAIVTLMTAKQENCRLHNWSMKLTEFEFSEEYRKGKENIVADYLSCCHGDKSDNDVDADDDHQQKGKAEDVGIDSPHELESRNSKI